MPNRGRGEPDVPDWAAPPIRKNCLGIRKELSGIRIPATGSAYARATSRGIFPGHRRTSQKNWRATHHGAREARLEAKASDESRTGIGSRWIVVARGRRVGGTGCEPTGAANRTELTNSPSARKKSGTSAWPRSTFSTRKTTGRLDPTCSLSEAVAEAVVVVAEAAAAAEAAVAEAAAAEAAAAEAAVVEVVVSVAADAGADVVAAAACRGVVATSARTSTLRLC